MNVNLYRSCLAAAISFMLALFISMSCKKAEEAAPREESPAAISKNSPQGETMSVSDETAGGKLRHAAKDKKEESRPGIIGHFLTPMELGRERLLEYKVDLTYETRELMKSRQELLGIVAKYGFIKGSNASLEDKIPMSVSDVYVKSDKLYEALLEFDRVGTLLAEHISVMDHTEEMALQERTVKREQLRIGRKNAAVAQVAPAAKNWNDIENSLAQSEDRLDAAEHATWKIRDKVAWALIHVNLKGPDQPDRIIVPRYSDAFIGMINILLGFLYIILYILPFAVIAGLIIWKWKQIAAIFRRKKREE
jgi:hypothetical protein